MSGYHIRESGASAVEELAFTFANGIAYVDAALARGLSIDEFAPSLFTFLSAGTHLLEEVSKFRAARRVWSSIVGERYGARLDESRALRIFAFSAGSSLTAQQPMNNIVRADMLCSDLVGALYGPSDGYLDGQQLCMTYAAQAAALGVRILARHSLVGYETGHRRKHRLITAREPIECDIVLNAAGAWAAQVGEILGAPVAVLPERHQACVMRLAQRLPYVLPS
jgi:methylmalonyl-CoA mutase N-terminal domain/subunit